MSDARVSIDARKLAAIRQYLGARPYDEVAAACAWIDEALEAAMAADADQGEDQ